MLWPNFHDEDVDYLENTIDIWWLIGREIFAMTMLLQNFFVPNKSWFIKWYTQSQHTSIYLFLSTSIFLKIVNDKNCKMVNCNLLIQQQKWNTYNCLMDVLVCEVYWRVVHIYYASSYTETKPRTEMTARVTPGSWSRVKLIQIRKPSQPNRIPLTWMKMVL